MTSVDMTSVDAEKFLEKVKPIVRNQNGKYFLLENLSKEWLNKSYDLLPEEKLYEKHISIRNSYEYLGKKKVILKNYYGIPGKIISDLAKKITTSQYANCDAFFIKDTKFISISKKVSQFEATICFYKAK